MHFPFSAIVGQPQLKTALLLCAVDTTLGGVLIRGDKGTAKSTAARALTAILPPIERIAGCAFNCLPGTPCGHCEICSGAAAVVQPCAVPFITLPLGATEDRVLGTLDLERALQGARRAFQPGLLAAAHRGILYIDEVNLLADHLVDVLLDVAAMGVNSVQREGLSVTHPARFTLIGTMNLEEGDLRPQLLDRFGLMVEVAAPREKTLRAEVVRRRIAFETDPAAYVSVWAQQQHALRVQLATAQQLLPKVLLDDELLDLISHLCCEFDVASLRADIVMHKASRALAALDGRLQVTPDDVRSAAQLVLPHRRRRKPFEQPGLDQDRLDELMQQASPPPEQESDASSGDDGQQPESGQDSEQETEQETGQQVFAAAAGGAARRIAVDAVSARPIAGRRSAVADAPRGRVVRAVPDQNPTSLAVGATLRSAALRTAATGQPLEFRVSKNDLHQQIRAGKSANLILFVVDASGSMAAQRRMEAVKGAVLALLTDAYQRRDEVAVISFRGEAAALLLAPTRSVDRAEQGLRELPTGGRTPLPHALQLALETLEQAAANGAPPLLVLLSDGKANVALSDGGDPWRETLALAEMLAGRAVPALVLDTETGYLRLGRAAQLAQALGAECLTLEELSAESLVLTIRGCMKAT
ncbi:MAG: putative cobaltochelatase [Oxalobacteraceae bacterium]|nr:putative cobaltochelatase [Oxalobacteraceae bacterium]